MLSVSRLAYELRTSVGSGAWSWVDLQSLRRRKCRGVHSPQQTLPFPVAPTRLRRSSDHDSGSTGRRSDGRVLRSRHRPASSSKPILPFLLTPLMPLHLLLVLLLIPAQLVPPSAPIPTILYAVIRGYHFPVATIPRTTVVQDRGWSTITVEIPWITRLAVGWVQVPHRIRTGVWGQVTVERLRFAVAASVHVDSVATHVEDRANRCVVVTSPARLLVRFHAETVHDAFVESRRGFRSRNRRRRHSRREGVARSCEPGPVYCSALTAARVERVFRHVLDAELRTFDVAQRSCQHGEIAIQGAMVAVVQARRSL